jgi:hypothetical protein
MRTSKLRIKLMKVRYTWHVTDRGEVRNGYGGETVGRGKLWRRELWREVFKK